MQYIEPKGPGIRVDSGFTVGADVTHFYDPLLAKLIVYAENRETAIQKMQSALKDFIVHGVVTNIDFMQSVLAHEDFANGKVTTRWVEKTLESGSLLPSMQKHTLTGTRASSLHIIAAALADLAIANPKSKIANSSELDPYSPWKSRSEFRN